MCWKETLIECHPFPLPLPLTTHKPACAQMHKRPDKKWCLQNGGTFDNATFLQEKGEEKESFIKHLSYQAIIDNY